MESSCWFTFQSLFYGFLVLVTLTFVVKWLYPWLGKKAADQNHTEENESEESEEPEPSEEQNEPNEQKDEATDSTKGKDIFKVIELPREPPKGTPSTEYCVFHLKVPEGPKLSRRFWKSHKIAILFDYMESLGFSQEEYTLVERGYGNQTDISPRSQEQINAWWGYIKPSVLFITRKDS